MWSMTKQEFDSLGRSFMREIEISDDLIKQIHQAVWDNDQDKLQELAPCDCCCDEHTFGCCPARIWNGCRGGGVGQLSIREIGDDYQKWYSETRGMSEDDFFGWGD